VPESPRWICLDVGETLIDETRVWSVWADILEVPRLTLMAALGAVILRRAPHQELFEAVRRPDWRHLRTEFDARYGSFRPDDLYPDALDSIARLRDLGYRIAIIANQPASRTEELRRLGVEADVIAMSDELGLWKPDPEFFARALALMGDPDRGAVAYVGDRLDNDVRPSLAAGMRAVWLRRGPWGVIGDAVGPPTGTAMVVDSLAELADRATSLWPVERPGHMTLTVVGSAPAWSLRAGAPSSCYLLELDGAAIVLDLGHGSFGALSEIRRPDSVAAVVISHLHPDHHADLVPLRQYLKWGLGDGAPKVALHAPADLRGRYDAFLGEEGFLGKLPGAAIEEGTFSIGPFRIEARRVTHAHQSFAFRVSPWQLPDAPGLVYSGDCGRWQDLLLLIRPGDTLLSEAFWGVTRPDTEALHLTAAEAAEAARAGSAARLLLTHIGEPHDPLACVEAATAVFDGATGLAEPGLRVAIP
jgi:HAD superfamily hydrolase (TIGR01549 family)